MHRSLMLLIIAHTLMTTQSVLAFTDDSTDFDTTIAPILAGNCLECHGGTDPEGELNLSVGDLAAKGGDSGQVIVAGDAEASILWQRIASDEMPPKHPLGDKEKQAIKSWITAGAKWGTSPIDPFARTTSRRAGYDWWSLQKLQKVEPPSAGNSNWPRNAVDQFVLQRLKDANLHPSDHASPRTQIRRLYFDLIGLPPTPDEIAAFLSDPSDEAYRKIVEDLLSSQHYGERWGRHWLDVVRYGESDGFERNMARKSAWYYRDWVIEALNNDMPYDEFVRLQLIGDQLQPGPTGAAATGFWVAGVHNTVVGGSERMKKLAREDELEEVLATVGQTFLGLTVNCGRCHDHKFDPISQKEYYQLTSAISGLRHGETKQTVAEEAEKLEQLDRTLREMSERLAKIDSAARRQIIAERKSGKLDAPALPTPTGLWHFDEDLRDSIGSLHGTAQGNTRIEDGALVLDGSSFVSTPAVEKAIESKTLEVWVQLDNTSQRGGAAISLETPNGSTFDAIVFGEQERKRWMAGSNVFARTESFQGPDEEEVVDKPVQVVMVYDADGTIRAYRNGLPYGQPIRKAPLQSYKSGDSEILFGLRHRPGGGNRYLTGRVHKAAFYDRALSPEEVAATAGQSAEFVSDEAIAEWLPDDERASRQDLKSRIAELTTARQQQAERATLTMYTLMPDAVKTTRILLRGDPANPGDVVAPGGVNCIAEIEGDFQLAVDAPEPDRRRALADWITDSANPLFARVVVNRIWHYHFGTGIVDTPNDLGFNGGRPSHPELLEWLAGWFRTDGKLSLKNLHRLIVLSSTYRQSSMVSDTHAKAAELDTDNRLLWRMNARRLEAELVRDAMLSVSGKLNPAMGGPSFEDVSITFNAGTTYYAPIDVAGENVFRRTVYRFNPRGGRSALLDTFDCPDPAATAPRRAVTTTPLQALSLLNNSFVLRMADELANRVRAEAGDSAENQIRTAWQLAVGRPPTKSEQELSATLVSDHGLPALCRGLFNTNEFVVVE